MFKQDPDAAMVAAHEAKWLAKETLEKVYVVSGGGVRLDISRSTRSTRSFCSLVRPKSTTFARYSSNAAELQPKERISPRSVSCAYARLKT
jgi:hypothetical protein